MILRLQHQRPDGEMDTYHLKPGRKFNIGRGSSCEVRILDLKLSRKHCAVEYVGDGWRVEDLLSTNGCKLDGEQIVGTVPLRKGGVIEIGQSRLLAVDIVDSDASEDESGLAAAVPAAAQSAAGATANGAAMAAHAPAAGSAVRPKLAASEPARFITPVPDKSSVVQEDMPDEDQAKSPSESELDSHPWEPEPASEALTKTSALAPNPEDAAEVRRAIAAQAPLPEPPPLPAPRVGRVRPVTIRVGSADAEAMTPTSAAALADPAPAAESPAAAPTPLATPVIPAVAAVASEPERTFFITVLGQRIGPLARSDARDLKARELKGTLTPTDLVGYPKG